MRNKPANIKESEQQRQDQTFGFKQFGLVSNREDILSQATLSELQSQPVWSLQYKAENTIPSYKRISSNLKSWYLDRLEKIIDNNRSDDFPGMTRRQIHRIRAFYFYYDFPLQCQTCHKALKEDERVMQLSCRHLFHQDCVIQRLKKDKHCPNCHTSQIESQQDEVISRKD